MIADITSAMEGPISLIGKRDVLEDVSRVSYGPAASLAHHTDTSLTERPTESEIGHSFIAESVCFVVHGCCMLLARA